MKIKSESSLTLKLFDEDVDNLVTLCSKLLININKSNKTIGFKKKGIQLDLSEAEADFIFELCMNMGIQLQTENGIPNVANNSQEGLVRGDENDDY